MGACLVLKRAPMGRPGLAFVVPTTEFIKTHKARVEDRARVAQIRELIN
jgi:hypothetical protein